MATLGYLADSGQLIRHTADLEGHEQPVRLVYFAPEFAVWLSADLRGRKRDRARDLSPLEQVEQALYDFVIGRPLAYGRDCRKLDPLTADIWELKTEDVRIVGWAPRPACFIAVCGCMKKDLPKFKDYAPLIQAARDFREALDLDPPKAMQGVVLNEVF